MKLQPELKAVKYIQLADSIRRQIIEGNLKKGDALPSINGMAKSEKVARDTVVKAYSELRRRGIIEASHGKGFFIKDDQLKTQRSVLLVFDVINAYKERLFNGFRDHLNDSIATELYFHHFNPKYFESLLEDQKNNFDLFVVMGYSNPRINRSLRRLPEERTVLLDRKIRMKQPQFRFVGQDHEGGFREALKTALDRIRKYDRIRLIFPEEHYHPLRIKDAFTGFCKESGITGSISKSLSEPDVSKGVAYFVIDEDDLIAVVKACQMKGWELGKDVGLVSYNDTPMMEIIAGGISVITTDFYSMGKELAEKLVHGFGADREVLIPTLFKARKTL